ncbi:MAG: 2-octaprenyl-3-methyl-6-methoxy-1,4-benzoquinol hydroxylase [Moraxellaceae bacterium]|nr:MAG: 2-octaprenyl-3-methyl-6-methoxy-1,4-benzoquinol hydroxylase [Moraxellaceae bacterium]
MTQQQADIVIVGGGMAGLACASAMAACGLQIVVLDKTIPQGPDSWGEAFDPRVSAITRASENILKHCGAWEFIQSQRIAEYSAMDVWDADGTGNVQFHAEEAAVDYLGHIVENRVTQYGLYLACLQHDNVQVLAVGMSELSQEGAGWLIELDNGEQLRPSLVVGADGANSQVREQAGLETREWDYDHNAIVTTVTTEKPHGNVARQPFLTTGPLGFLPLRANSADKKSNISSIVWSAEGERAEELMAMDEAEFNRALGFAMEGRLGSILTSDRRFSFPLRQRHAIDYVADGLALVADAAHTLHPLAGQGINMGFLDVAVLAEQVCSSVAKGLSPGEPMALRRYQRRRKGHNLLMMSTMEGFKRLFGAEPMPVRLLRNTGMKILNGHRLAKGHILKHAMGLSGELPDAAKPGLIADF